MRIAKWYKLHKDGEFYFLYRDRYSFIPNDHATKLSSALCRLSKSPSQGSASAKTELADERAPPVRSKTVEEMTQGDQLNDGDITMQHGSITTQHEDNKIPLSATEAGARLPPRDIQIQVQRPSPVREAPTCQRKLFSVGTVADLKDAEQEVSHKPVENAAKADTKQSTLAEDSSLNKDELESSSSGVTREVPEHRVRPTSGPATVMCPEPQEEFSLVRKSLSVTNSLDEDGDVMVDFLAHSRRSIGATTHDFLARPFASSISSSMMGFSTAKDSSIRRIHSTVSFDQPSLKSPDSSVDIDEAADLLNRRASAQKTVFCGLRSRHTSGLETPLSALDTSSVTSTTEAGTTLIVSFK